MSLKIVSIIIVCICISCSTKHGSFEDYLYTLSQNIEKDSLNKFKHSIIEINEGSIDLVYEEVEKSVSELPKNSKVSLFLDSISNSIRTKSIFVSIALHQYCNDKTVDRDTVKKLFYNLENKKRKEKIKLRNIEIQRISEENNLRFEIGDTISATFLIDTSLLQKRIYYNKWITEAEFELVNPVVKLSAIVKDKFYGTTLYNNSEHNELFFKCKVLKISDSNVLFNEQILKPNLTIDINVLSYGRLFSLGSKYE